MQFGSDNQTGASKKVLEMIGLANDNYTHGYGEDEYTSAAVAELKKVFECDYLEAFFVPTGTAANCLALACLAQPWESILCHAQSHVIMDESTAPEFFTGGARLIGLAKGEGKITPKHLLDYLKNAPMHTPHNSKAKVLSLTQATELGLVYSAKELEELTKIAHQNNLLVHVDGARFTNALVSQNCSAAELSWKAGVDILCLGASKSGCLAAEAVLIFKPELAEQFIHRRKRSGHLLSKGRFFGAQMLAWLKDDHWLDLARHANNKAKKLVEKLSAFEGIEIVWPCQANEVFIAMPKKIVSALHEAGAEFYEWYSDSLPEGFVLKEDKAFVRLVTSFKTEDSQIEEFSLLIKRLLKD